MFPGIKTPPKSVLHLYQNYRTHAKRCFENSATALNLLDLGALRSRQLNGFALFERHSCHATSIGAATAIDEYVPIRIPTTSANENPRNTGPPNIYSDSTVRNVSPEVSTVRLSVWLMLRFTTSGRDSRRLGADFRECGRRRRWCRSWNSRPASESPQSPSA